MIRREEINDLIGELKSHTLSSLRATQKDILPYIITCRDNFPTADMEWESLYSRIAPVRKYHYKDNSYLYRYSDDNPENTIGILRVEGLVFKNFDHKNNKWSFISSLEALVWQDYLQPFLLFKDNKVVNWNDIDVVFDSNECFLLLHGEKYNYLELEKSDFKIVTLPFAVGFVGTETDDEFNCNYNALQLYMQDSLVVRDGKQYINVPTLEGEYQIGNIIYPVGAWMYKQNKLYHLGVLSEDRVSKLKKMMLYTKVYDEVTNEIQTVYTRFNALDRDSCDKRTWESICFNYLDEQLLFSFNDEGLFDPDGPNKWYLLSDKMYHDTIRSSDEYIYGDHSDIENILQRENYIVFRNGLLDIDCELVYGLNNLMLIKNTTLDNIAVVTLYHKDLTPVWMSGNLKFDRDYLNAKAREYFDVNRKVRNGVQAILMDEDYNLTDRVIQRIDVQLQDLYLGYQHRDVTLLNPPNKIYEIIALLMDNIDQFNGKIWRNLKVINDLYCNDIEMLDSEYRKIYAYLMEENDHFDGMILSESFTLVDVAEDKNLELLKGSMYAITEDGRYLSLSEYLTFSDPKMYNDNLAIINRDYSRLHAYLMSSIDEYTGEEIIFNDDYLQIEPKEVPIDFINHSGEVMALTMNDDGSFTGKIIHDVLNYHPMAEDPTMLLDGVVFLNYGDGEINDYVNECMKYLDYEFSRVLPYETNVDNAIQSIIDYDVSIFNRLNHTTIRSICLNGLEVNSRLYDPHINGISRALKINRDIVNKHESFCLVFLNGILIESYSRMISQTNQFILPIDNDLLVSDILEVMWFDYVDNNEIHFRMTDGIRDNLIATKEDGTKYISIYGEVIPNSHMKLFEKYPSNVLEYKDVIEPSHLVAFNVSYTDDDGKICLLEGVDSNDDEFIAVSSRKFVYERLDVNKKSYRIQLSKRFRYCDNIKQYMLFINGRRINEDSYFVTIPKYTRPFDRMWLYLAKFIDQDDRVELFYLPEEMYNDNRDNFMELKEDGYIVVDKSKLDVPLDNRLYAFFINGKKIPSNTIETINSYILRIKKDTLTTMPLVVHKLYKDNLSEVSDYMHDSDRLCVYDKIIEDIRTSIYLGKDEINNLFKIYARMSNIESNKLSTQVGRIAVINEIIRDFWGKSGFNYNIPGFTYDYDIDEITARDSDGNIVMPAYDGISDENIIKNDTHLLYFNPDNDEVYFEKGSSISNIRFVWEYALGNPHDPDVPLEIVHQDINGVEIDPNERYFDWTDSISDTTKFLFTGNSGYQLLQMVYMLKSVSPVFYGNISKDALENYKLSGLISLEELIALIPKKGRQLPSMEEIEEHQKRDDIWEDLKRDYYIWRDLSFVNKASIVDYEIIYDLIAILPNEYEDLFDLELWKDLAEQGMAATLERYKYLTFDGLLLVDPNEDPIEWIHWLKAIIPADGDVMHYPDRLIPPDGIVLLDDRIDSLMAILLRDDGKLSTKKWWHLFSIDEEDQSWMFFQWLNTDMDNVGYLKSTVERAEIPEGITPLLRGAPKPVLSDDLVTDLTFVNTDKDVIGNLMFFTIADWANIEWLTKDILAYIMNDDGTINDDYYNDIIFKCTDTSKIGALGYKKDRWGLPRTKFLDEEGMKALIMDEDGNLTGDSIDLDINNDYALEGLFAEDIEYANIDFSEESGGTDSVELDENNQPTTYHLDIGDATLNVINPDGSVTLGDDEFNGLIAYIYDENGEFHHNIYTDPRGVYGQVLESLGVETDEVISMDDIIFMLMDSYNTITTIIYLNDETVYALTMDEDGNFNIDKQIIEEPNINISLNSKDYNVYALAMNKDLKVDEETLSKVIKISADADDEVSLNSNIMALLMNDDGTFNGKTIYDIFNTSTEHTELLQLIDSNPELVAMILDEDGNETDKIINLIDYIGKHPSAIPKEKVDRIIDLSDDDYLLNDNDDSIGLFFINDLSTIITSETTLMSGFMEREYDKSIDDVVNKYTSSFVDANENFIFIDTSIDNIYLLHDVDGIVGIHNDEISIEDITAMYKNLNGDYILVDNNEVPFAWLKRLYAITESGNRYDLAEAIPPHDLDNSYSRILAILDNGTEVELNMMDDTTVVEPSYVDLHKYLTGEDIVDIGDITDPEGIIILDAFTDYHRYNSEADLKHMMAHLEKHLQEDAELDIRYPISNNNYWIYCIPKSYALNKDGSKKIEFYMQDLKDPDLLDHASNKYSIPLYGKIIDGMMTKIDHMDMEYLGETEYTSEYGISQQYIVYRTNGYFHKLFDEYGIHIQCKNKVS